MSFFDNSNPQHRQLAEAHQSGDYSQVDAQQATATYKGFVNHGPEAEVQAVHQEYFNQMPKVQQMGLFSSLINAARQNGIDPRQAGVSTTDPQQASSFDLGNLFNLARSSGLLGGGQSQSSLGSLAGGLFGNSGSSSNQNPSDQQNSSGFGSLGNILNNPIAQSAISGLIGYAANRAFGGNKAQAAAQTPQSNQSQPGEQSLPGIQSLPQTQPDQNGFQDSNLPQTPPTSW